MSATLETIDEASPLLPCETRVWVLASGKIGHEVNCLGAARALGLAPRLIRIAARPFFTALAPYGPVDPRLRPGAPGSPFAPPYPDLLLASGRTTVPYFRALKRWSKRRTFAVFLQDPRWGRRGADLIWTPAHDHLRGENVFVTPTSPHPFRPDDLRAARLAPDNRVAALPMPRLAMFLGGPSSVYRFEERDKTALAAIARQAIQCGMSVMATPSRRTSAETIAAIATALAESGERSFVWDGTGDNPYLSMLANAQAILVTADSVNMVGESLASAAPVYVYEPTGGDARTRGFVDRLVDQGQIRRWSGAFEYWPRAPLDATGMIARAIAERYRRFRRERSPQAEI